MKVTYLKLVNVAGLLVGSNKKEIEISFVNAKNKIVAIQGENGIGKSVLLSSISPFSGPTSVDERSTLNYIIAKKEGYKEIHYLIGEDKYIIKHYYKPSGKSHSVKSYISRNGEELNENGNVRSFLALVEVHFGLTEEMMRLVRLGTNVNSFITLTPAKRKEYIGKLIDEIDAYLIIHKNISEDLRVVKTMMANNNANLYKCHITDLVVEEEELKKLEKKINKLEKEKERLIAEIGKLQSLISKNDIDDVRKKKHELEASLEDLHNTEKKIKELSLEKVTLDDLMKKRSNFNDDKISVQSSIKSYKMSIDNTHKQIERLELTVKKVASNNDVRSLIERIKSLQESIKGTSDVVKSFHSSCTSEDIQHLITKITSFNQISQMIYTFGNRPLNTYLRLKDEKKSVDKFLKDQMKKASSKLNEADVLAMLEQIFGKDSIITPNCVTEFEECPYFRLDAFIRDMKDYLEEESYDSETLRYIQVIANNIDNILNELDYLRNTDIPKGFKNEMQEEYIFNRLRSKDALFDLSKYQEYLSLVKDHEIYQKNCEQLSEYEYQLSIYKKSGVDNQMAEIEELKKSVNFYNDNIAVLTKDIERIDNELEVIDLQISLVTKYQDSKKYKGVFESSLEATEKILRPLETATTEKSELEFELRQTTNEINLVRQNHKELETKIHEYNRLVEENEKLSEQHKDLSMILKVVSTKEGIPVIYMKKYLGKIKKLANNLLKLIYDDTFQLAKFNVDADTFEVPYVKNGIKVSDIKYASQSEVALATMALSFALANKATGIYNILFLDEIDAGLDEANRALFLKMLYKQMMELRAEQVFIISHNMSQMVNVPMDCIRLSEVAFNSKMQNVIYDAVA